MAKENVTEGNIRKKNKALILQAAKIEFVDHGFKGASIKRIGERAGIPRANIHYYFKDKTDIYQQLLASILDAWNSHDDALNAEMSPKESLSAYIKAKVLFSRDEPNGSKIFASEIIHGAPVLADYLSEDFKAWVKLKVATIESWIEQQLIDPINPYHLLFLIWSSTQHYADFNVQVLSALDKTEMTDDDYQAVIDSLTSIILKGCGVK